MQTTLQGIAQKAKRLKKYRFRNLYREINVDTLKWAWRFINKKASAGIDRVTAREFEKDFDKNINDTAENLKQKRYRAKFVRRAHIPKGRGKTRPLGIPALIDKLIQVVVAKILMAIYEQDFTANSYGYRPNLGALDAVEAISKELQYGKYNYIVEADIKGFFDNMDHDWIIRMLEERIDDRAFISLIKKWLKAGILETDGEITHPSTGSPQGGIVSPVISNIYLHYALDLWFEKIVKPSCNGAAYCCRYADDFVCAFQSKTEAERFYRELKERLRKFGLKVAEEKTNIIRFSRYQKQKKEENTAFDFLGFEFRWGISRNGKMIIKKRTSPEKLRKSLQNITEWCKHIGSMRRKDIFRKLNRKLIGYYNYYGVIGNYDSLSIFFFRMQKILYKWLRRKSCRSKLNWEKFNKYLEIYRIETPRITKVRGGTQRNFEFSFV